MPVATVNGRKFLFIHVPKTGGMAMSAFLHAHATVTLEDKVEIDGRLVRARHLHGAAYEQLFPSGAFDWSFVIVRHPVARLVSEYTFQTRKSGFHIQNLMSFPVWLRYSFARADADPGYRDNHFRPQAEFQCFDCDVFRMEEGLDRAAEAFRTRAGLVEITPVARRNASPAGRVDIGIRERALIRERYAGDFELFGYDPEGS